MNCNKAEVWREGRTCVILCCAKFNSLKWQGHLFSHEGVVFHRLCVDFITFSWSLTALILSEMSGGGSPTCSFLTALWPDALWCPLTADDRVWTLSRIWAFLLYHLAFNPQHWLTTILLCPLHSDCANMFKNHSLSSQTLDCREPSSRNADDQLLNYVVRKKLHFSDSSLVALVTALQHCWQHLASSVRDIFTNGAGVLRSHRPADCWQPPVIREDACSPTHRKQSVVQKTLVCITVALWAAQPHTAGDNANDSFMFMKVC